MGQYCCLDPNAAYQTIHLSLYAPRMAWGKAEAVS